MKAMTVKASPKKKSPTKRKSPVQRASASRRKSLRRSLRKKSAKGKRKVRKVSSVFCRKAGSALRSCHLGKKSPVARPSNWSFNAFGAR
jgi:hypothetical protein